MTVRAFMQRLAAKIACLLVFVLAVSACDRDTPLLAVKAVAAGVPSLAPFFDERSGLGKDAQDVASQPVRGSLQQGDTPGLYGGSKQPAVCDVDRLKAFLTDPRNDQKARAWARALGITTAEIPEYLDRLTPVLLRHDTLVKNHDYKKGKAVPYDSLLQAGIAILVDRQGQPAAKCSCGNPLRPFAGDTSRISVEFENGNKEWQGYDRSSVVAVRPASRPLEKIALVDVADPDRGINRPVGTTGAKDDTFDTRTTEAVPRLAGKTFGQARQALADKGLATGYDTRSAPADSARVTATDPPAGTTLRFGQYVTVSVAEGSSPGGGPTSPPPSEPPPSTPSTSGPSTPGTSPPGTSPPGSSGGTSKPPPSSTPSPGTPSGPSTSASPSPPTSPSTSVTSAPPAVTSSPPLTTTSAPPPVTTVAPPPETTGAPPPSSESAPEEPTASVAT
ncbi:PASTA domain-containing protein [Streptomyces sp. NBC_00663]|uniref:PASTA domain-containing protein n=1 Tax=Streptomyces sp. NBC_00663 TaxID=2975801 RepID=UPI002E2F134B|nr:PASTA domain-containing protein [Streptomyces sp. NBC_00663]